MPSAEQQANALITLLENLQPRWALTPHLSRLEAIVAELKGGTSTSCSLSPRPEEAETTTRTTTTTTTTLHHLPPLKISSNLKSKLVLHTTNSNVLNNSSSSNSNNLLTPSSLHNKRNSNLLTPASLLLVKQQPQQQVSSYSSSYLPTAVATNTRKGSGATTSLVINKAAQKVWNDPSLVSRILDFDGSLGYYYRHYHLLVGYERPKPFTKVQQTKNLLLLSSSSTSFSSSRRSLLLAGSSGHHSTTKERGNNNNNNNSIVIPKLVNKACQKLIYGPEGLQHLQVAHQTLIEKQISIAKQTKSDVTVSWLARVYAMAMADDALSLDAIIRRYNICYNEANNNNSSSNNKTANRGSGITTVATGTTTTGFGPFGEALDLYYDGEYFELRLPAKHPFEGCAVTDLVEFRLDHDYGDQRRQLVLIGELAYNALRVGALRALEILKRHYFGSDWGLHYLEFDDKHGGDFLSTFLRQECFEQPFHTTPKVAQGIRTLLRGEVIGLDSHERVFGSVGNQLHLAAARGDIELVKALLDCGFDPSIKCDQSTNCFKHNLDVDHHKKKERLDGQKELPLPEDWARVRGHAEVAQLLEQRRKKLRPDLRQIRFQNRPFYTGKLTRFFSEPNRLYGFIQPDNGGSPVQQGGGVLRGGSNGVFVHLSNLQRGAKNDGHSNLGFPTPGQRLAFTVRKDRRGRPRAEMVISADDYSYVNLLQMTGPEAEEWWNKYHRDGTDDEGSDDDDEETDNDSYAVENDNQSSEVPTSINIPFGVEDGYLT